MIIWVAAAAAAVDLAHGLQVQPTARAPTWDVAATALGGEQREHRESGAPESGGSANRYLIHQTCDDHQGIGAHLRFSRGIIDLAISKGMTYVCNPYDFTPGQHSTGPLGDLFGCVSSSEARADPPRRMVSWGSVVKEGVIGDVKDKWIPVVPKAPLKFVQFTERDMHKDIFNESNTLYALVGKCPNQGPWSASCASWLAGQYHAVRNNAEPARHSDVVCGFKDKMSTVVVHVRRGDHSIQFPVKAYIEVLRKVFNHEFEEISADLGQSRIVVIAETREDDPEMLQFKQAFQQAAQVVYWLGEAAPVATGGAELAWARDRFVRDMDCMSTADVLVKSKSELSQLAGALNMKGKSLTLDTPTKEQTSTRWEVFPKLRPDDEIPDAYLVTFYA